MEIRTLGGEAKDQRQMCKACGKRDAFDFHVSDETWARVVPLHLRELVVCLTCFDEFARVSSVSYAKEITTLYFAGERAVIIFKTASATDVA